MPDPVTSPVTNPCCVSSCCRLGARPGNAWVSELVGSVRQRSMTPEHEVLFEKGVATLIARVRGGGSRRASPKPTAAGPS